MKKRRSRSRPILEHIKISDVAAEGKSLCRVNNMVMFIPFGAPGDIVDVVVTAKKKNFLEGEILKFHKKSNLRVKPFCEHFGLCGGCKWQHLPYSLQLEYKRKHVIDSLERIGGLNNVNVKPVLFSDKETYYRNKLEYTFTDRRWLTNKELPESGERPPVNFNGLGFHLPGRYDRILDINRCYLQPEPSNDIRLFIKQNAEENNIPFFNIRNQSGILRNLIIRNNKKSEFMVILVVSEINDKIKTLLNDLKVKYPQIVSLNYIINKKSNDDISDLDPVCYSGSTNLTETIGDLHFSIGQKSFFQTNSEQVAKLYSKTLEFANLSGIETVYDLYTGAGTIANFAAPLSKKVIGIEYVEEAVIDARKNSENNCIKNTTFISGDISKVMNDNFTEKHGNPHVIVADPPRAGMHPFVIERIIELLPERVVYVSCNPATQARDISLLSKKYSVKEVQPIDMFPHTHHIENIVLLVKEK